MAGICEACRNQITVIQKRIKCTNCLQLFHSECINYSNEAVSRSHWKCPKCVASTRKGGDNNNTPIRNTKTGKEITIALPVGEPTSKAQLSPSAANSATLPESAVNSPLDQTSIIRQIENVFDRKFELLKNEIIENLKCSLIAEFRNELSPLYTNLKQLEITHTKLAEDHIELQEKVHILQKKASEDLELVLDLKAQLNKQQQWARMSNIEIVGLPETPNESPVELMIRISKHAGVALQPAQIESAHRVQPMRRVEGRSKPVVVKLQNRMLKDEIISGLRRTKGITTQDIGLGGPSRRFYVNEHLTPENKQLLKEVKLRAKNKSYKFIWVRNCNIFLRRNEESPVITIGSEKHLQKIV